MNTTGVNSALRAAQTAYAAKPEAASPQVALLKRALDAQKQQAAQMLKLTEQKGQVLDIRA